MNGIWSMILSEASIVFELTTFLLLEHDEMKKIIKKGNKMIALTTEKHRMRCGYYSGLRTPIMPHKKNVQNY